MRQATILITLLALLTGCASASAYKRAYITGSTVKTFVEEAHSSYDKRAQAQLAKCDPDKNPESKVATQVEFDACMTKPFELPTQEAIVRALAIYRAVAVMFTAVMLGCEPPPMPADLEAPLPEVDVTTCVARTFTDAELRAWRGKVVDAAITALRQFPDADKLVTRLTTLVK